MKTFEEFVNEKKKAKYEDKKKKKSVEEGNAFVAAAAKAKAAGQDTFEFEGETYPVEIKDTGIDESSSKDEFVYYKTKAKIPSLGDEIINWPFHARRVPQPEDYRREVKRQISRKYNVGLRDVKIVDDIVEVK